MAIAQFSDMAAPFDAPDWRSHNRAIGGMHPAESRVSLDGLGGKINTTEWPSGTAADSATDVKVWMEIRNGASGTAPLGSDKAVGVVARYGAGPVFYAATVGFSTPSGYNIKPAFLRLWYFSDFSGWTELGTDQYVGGSEGEVAAVGIECIGTTINTYYDLSGGEPTTQYHSVTDSSLSSGSVGIIRGANATEFGHLLGDNFMAREIT
jgi:hypothetical protein